MCHIKHQALCYTESPLTTPLVAEKCDLEALKVLFLRHKQSKAGKAANQGDTQADTVTRS